MFYGLVARTVSQTNNRKDNCGNGSNADNAKHGGYRRRCVVGLVQKIARRSRRQASLTSTARAVSARISALFAIFLGYEHPLESVRFALKFITDVIGA